jgi:DNA-binding PadR family transcriptional regulator
MRLKDSSVLGYALLGLIQRKPSSGYDLRKLFAETAMGNYSSSPGAIYPALERLQAQGLVLGIVKDMAGLRRRRLYRLTAKGSAELSKWLTRPIERSDVKRGVSELMLRFAFTEQALGAAAAIAFLQQFRAALKPYAAGLQVYLRANAASMPLSGRLALECGVRGYRSMYAWTGYAIRQYRQSQSGTDSRPAKTRKGGPR